MFESILIANRGEIACRIIRTARRLGVRTVAVYSDADRDALHVSMADEAHRIGPGPARDSYLSIGNILVAARASGANAIHPGYGFLSESAEFAEACRKAGVTFIGPSPETIRAIGDKARAKETMRRAGVPVVPGYDGEDQDAARLAREAAAIGFPVIIKAAAGGGGRGMRIVREVSAFANVLESAKREAESSFGDGRVIVEKYLVNPRHIEVQVFGDASGNVVHMFERDCSAQRRHQKVIEEAPAPHLADEVRRALCEAAVKAARAVNYVNAGTAEFLLDGGKFYFIEMNTRLQVEHPATEMITGLDLVEWQIRIAAGEKLQLSQDDIRAHGHAIEARLYAEDPARDFLPANGALSRLHLPTPAKDLRIETGVREGDTVTIYYDSMLAKLVASGGDRVTALTRLEKALATTRIAGIANNRDFLLRICRHPDFERGGIDTGFIERERAMLAPAAAPFHVLAAAGLITLHDDACGSEESAARSGDPHSPWNSRDGWRITGGADYELRFSDATGERKISVRFANDSNTITLDESRADARLMTRSGDEFGFELDGIPHLLSIVRDKSDFTIIDDAQSWRIETLDAFPRATARDDAAGKLSAPLQGVVLNVAVVPGTHVKRGQVLMHLECMKLEYSIVAPDDGRVDAVHYKAGDVVAEGVLLIAFTPDNKE
jgi:3-methylcrotonyl-CoA carboxylase alpha subunit